MLEPVADLRSLDLLRSVASEGSIRRAAMAHHITQPAASMRLRTLESILGVTLLDRSKGRAVLTPEGMAVVQWGEEVLRSMHNLSLGVVALRGQRRERLRLSASMTVAEYFVPTWLHRFRSIAPTTAVSLNMGNSQRVLDDVRAGNADLGFVEGERAPTGLRSRVVTEDVLTVVVAPGHPWAKLSRPVTANDLGSVPLIVREEGSGTREVLEEALRRHSIVLRTLVELPSPTAIKAAVVAGGGPGVISRIAVSGDLESGRVVEVACADLSLARSIRAVWSSDKYLSPGAKKFLRLVEGLFAQ